MEQEAKAVVEASERRVHSSVKFRYSQGTLPNEYSKQSTPSQRQASGRDPLSTTVNHGDLHDSNRVVGDTETPSRTTAKSAAALQREVEALQEQLAHADSRVRAQEAIASSAEALLLRKSLLGPGPKTQLDASSQTPPRPLAGTSIVNQISSAPSSPVGDRKSLAGHCRHAL